MRAIVLGSGVVGTAAAYYLARDGHAVTVLERREAPGLETSYANAGLVAPGHSYAWASPAAPRILAKSLITADQALRLRPRLDPRMWSWLWRFLLQCTDERARANTRRKLRLCRYSTELLGELGRDTGVEYDGLAGGNLYVYRSGRSFEAGVRRTQLLRDEGLELEVLDRDGLCAREPALEPVRERLAGGLYSPTDRSGDARMFSRGLAEHCRAAMGVDFRFGVTVDGLEADGDRIAGVRTSRGRVGGDVFVLALGFMSPFVSRTAGVALPIYPVKGYSVTIPRGASNLSPRMGVCDEDRLVVTCPMGDRIRVAATAEFSGYDKGHRPDDFRGMLRSVRELFPSAGDYDRPEYWAGLRPMTPSSVPILGRARYRNLYLDTGHGHIGWTMACGSGKVTADLVAGREPEIDLEGLVYAG